MKRYILLLICAVVLFCLSGCAGAANTSQIAATTLPVYQFTTRLCQGTDITVSRLITEEVSCLHDYTLQVSQMRAIESAQAVVVSGAGLESFMDSILDRAPTLIDASEGIALHCGEHGHDDSHGHSHQDDPHIWLSPVHAAKMAQNICAGLAKLFPAHTEVFTKNLSGLLAELDALQTYGKTKLADLSCRKLITFHDGFSYFAESFDLEILKAIEEESGAEASAAELIQLIGLVEKHKLPAVFTEVNSADAAARIICAETGAQAFALDMCMGGENYFSAMYRNIDTVWEALQ